MKIDLRLGDWRVALAGETCDALITDPPYGKQTHNGHDSAVANARADYHRPATKAQRKAATAVLESPVEETIITHAGASRQLSGRRSVEYAFWTADDVVEFITAWAPRTRGWMACMTSDDLAPAYRAAYEAAGLYPFAPVPIIQRRPRLVGDGPASWTVYMMVARPRTREFATWGSLPGAYLSHVQRGAPVVGAKPIDVMRHIVRDYTLPRDVVCDPCAGGGSTLIAAAMENRIALGAEVTPAVHKRAMAIIKKGVTTATLLDV